MSDIELSDERISELFGYCNFGKIGETRQGRRGVMVECVLKLTCGFWDGHTIREICKEAGLLSEKGNPTKAGKQWAFHQIYKSGETILERLIK